MLVGSKIYRKKVLGFRRQAIFSLGCTSGVCGLPKLQAYWQNGMEVDLCPVPMLRIYTLVLGLMSTAIILYTKILDTSLELRPRDPWVRELEL